MKYDLVKITKATQWLLLDNLKHKWPYRTNMTREQADAALKWATENGMVADGQITPQGELALMTAPLPKDMENA